MAEYHETLNRFLVEIFHDILKMEEYCIAESGFQNLSIREMHVIEAVCRAEDQEADNRTSALADTLLVTAGTLSTSVSFLERKGYLRRQRDGKDKRVVRIFATPLGRQVNEAHSAFHREMVEGVLSALSEQETSVFVRALQNISTFFRQKYRSGQ